MTLIDVINGCSKKSRGCRRRQDARSCPRTWSEVVCVVTARCQRRTDDLGVRQRSVWPGSAVERHAPPTHGPAATPSRRRRTVGHDDRRHQALANSPRRRLPAARRL